MRSCRRLFAALLLLGAATACGGVSPVDTSVRTSELVVAPGTQPVHLGRLAAVLVDEAGAGGADLNGDGDAEDAVAAVLDLASRTETVLGLAATELAIVGEDVWILVDAAAQSAGPLPPGAAAWELHHWRRGDEAPVLVEAVDPAAPRLADSGAAVFYAAAAAPAAGESSLSSVDPSGPTAPVRVPTLSGEARVAWPLEARQGLVLVALPEGVGGNPDLNGDGDDEDAAVLGWVDGTVPGEPLYETGLALDPEAPVVAAERREIDDWLVGFLVSEDAQGADLDDPALFPPEWVPEGCPDLVADAAEPLGEDVLFVAGTSAVADGEAPVNTGIAGRDRIVVGPEYVATRAAEADARCDLNGDGEPDDVVARWVDVPPDADVGVAVGAIDELRALADAGPSRGLAPLGRRLVIVVDEAADGRDLDGDPVDRALVGSREPGGGAEDAWTFRHQSGVGTYDQELDQTVTSVPWVGTGWLAAEDAFGRLPLAYRESVSGLVLNRNDFCSDRAKDDDATDRVAAWARVRSQTERDRLEPEFPLTFPGTGYALADDPGLVVAGVRVFLRVSEAADAEDYNGDGDLEDDVVFESAVNVCSLRVLGEASAAGTGPAAFSDGASGAVFVSSESRAGEDWNGDGDTDDDVLRYFRF